MMVSKQLIEEAEKDWLAIFGKPIEDLMADFILPKLTKPLPPKPSSSTASASSDTPVDGERVD